MIDKKIIETTYLRKNNQGVNKFQVLSIIHRLGVPPFIIYRTSRQIGYKQNLIFRFNLKKEIFIRMKGEFYG